MAPRGLRLLCFDGGGVRGLSSLLILRNLMEKLKYADPEATDATPIPKPCDVFDMIGGTSTGGLIAVMLGRLKMSVDDCIQEYQELAQEIFDPKDRKRSKFTARFRGGPSLHIAPRYNAEKLKSRIEAVIKRAGKEGELLKSPIDGECKVFVCAADMRYDTAVFRSYRSHLQDSRQLDTVTIVEACMATAAAPGYFEGKPIDDQMFIDGGISDNNPIEVLCREARACWAEGQTPQRDLQARLKCLVSIGTGMPEPKILVSTDVWKLAKDLKRLALETKGTAERFRDTDLGRDPRYYRFNVEHGVAQIRLDQWQDFPILKTDTTNWCGQTANVDNLTSCAAALAGRVYSGPFATDFTLEGIPFVKKRFVDRPSEMQPMKACLLPKLGESEGRNVYVLHGMGGVGKTQLAINFAQQHQECFSSVFWLRSNTKTELHKSFSDCRRRIPDSQIPESCRRGGRKSEEDEEQAVVQEVLGWLRRPDNQEWLIIFDNIDLDYKIEDHVKQGAFNVFDYMPGDHGSFIITTRLQQMKEYGTEGKVEVVDRDMSRQIFERWYDQTLDNTPESDVLLGDDTLGGLPSLIAGAAIYMRQEHCSVKDYLRLWRMQQQDFKGTMGDISVTKSPPDYNTAQGATWVLSFKRIRDIQPYGPAAYEIIKLWAYLHNTAFWHHLLDGLRYPSQMQSGIIKWRLMEESRDRLSENVQEPERSLVSGKQKLNRHIPEPLLEAMSDEIHFYNAMSLLVDYGLVNKAQTHPDGTATNKGPDVESHTIGLYSMHSNIHLWARQMQKREDRSNSLRLALTLFTNFGFLKKRGWAGFRDLLPHAEVVLEWIKKHCEAFEDLGSAESEILNSLGFYKGLKSAASLFRRTGRLRECTEVLLILEESLTESFIRSLCRKDAFILWNVQLDVLRLQVTVHPVTLPRHIAEEKLRKALEISLELDPLRSAPFTWQAYLDLGHFYSTTKEECDKAERHLHELQQYLDKAPIQMRGSSWKKSIVDVQRLLGFCFLKRSMWDDARKTLEGGLIIARELDAQIGVLLTSLLLGQVYLRLEDFNEAERLMYSAYKYMMEYYGPHDSETLHAAGSLIYVYERQGKHAEALELTLLTKDVWEEQDVQRTAHEQFHKQMLDAFR